MFNSSAIDTANLEKAANQLWAILLPYLVYLSTEDQKIVELAFITMVAAHDQQRRKSGEYYIIHPVSACVILAKIHLDKDTLAACLMHDVPEDTAVTLKELSKNFSTDVVFLIEGVTKLSKIRYHENSDYIENLQRMFVAMSKDIRVILIKLADRLHNLTTLQHVAPEKQRRIALESLEIYAPIAERLGISFFRGEIEDAAFPYIFPQEYAQIQSEFGSKIDKYTELLNKIQAKTTDIFHKEGLANVKIKGRVKKYYSTFKKIDAKKYALEQIYDLIALRVVTQSVEDCYMVLSLLHRYFTPIDRRFKDYIKTPKPNGYQSLHTTVRDEETGTIFEFQIRTEQMNNFAEYGVASHWAYKDKTRKDFLKKGNYEWVEELLKLGAEDWSESEYMKFVKLDLFHDRIFVMTPKNDPIDLPADASPLDFAFKIHDGIGQKAIMAKVNGKTVELGYKLQNGDVVEILTSKNQTPKRGWLEIVRTADAARKIRRILRHRGEMIGAGARV